MPLPATSIAVWTTGLSYLTRPDRFLWAKLNVYMIQRERNLVELGSVIVLRSLLRKLPSKSADFIKMTLKAMENKSHVAGELSKTAMIWLTNLKQPLSLAALVESLKLMGEFHSQEVDKVIDWCRGLAVVDEGNSYVHLAPYDVNEVVRDLWAESYDTAVFKFASTCVNYLLLEKFGCGYCDTEERLIRLLEMHPFLFYAARSWAHHGRDAYNLQFSRTNAESNDDNTVEIAISTNSYADKDTRVGESIKKAASTYDDGDASKKDAQEDFTDQKNVESSGIKSRLGIQDVAERLLGKPNIRLALQILLYRDDTTTPLATQWAAHKEKIDSMSNLHKAARFGLTTLVNEWAANNLKACERDSEGLTPLHEAAKEGFEDVIELLLKNNMSPLAMNNYKKNPMHYAKRRGHHRAFSILFEKACAVIKGNYGEFKDIEDEEGFIIYYSVHKNGISDDPERSKEVAMTKAIKLKKEDVAIVLLHGGVDANCKDEAHVPASHLAIKTKSIPMLQELLDHDADPSTTFDNGDGESSLHLAARLGMVPVVQLLLRQGANPLHVDGHGRTILFSALEASDRQVGYDVTRLLLRRGINIDKRDENGRHILHEAARTGASRVLETLIYRVDDCSPVDKEGKTPLDYAREGGHEDAERSILEWMN